VKLSQASAVTDPAPSNNAASLQFTVSKAGGGKCVVISLANVPLGTAKKLLPALGCKVGKVSKTSSGKVAKGSVIKTTPGSGSYAAGKSIGIVVSSGPKKH
jgi:beta-lactam-binding protein with PASTA domain